MRTVKQRSMLPKLKRSFMLIVGKGPQELELPALKKKLLEVAVCLVDNMTIVLSELNKYFPQFKPVPPVLYTSLMNIGAVFHPTTVLLNTGRIESGETFEFYRDFPMTPAVTTALEKADEERCAIARALDVPISSALEWLQSAYGVNETTLRSALINNPAYQGIKAPTSLKVLYLLEDVPTALIPLTSLGELSWH
ncbi:NAD/NADP octopine/nopaline dehydrogenase family protein [Acetomicrobium sp.]|uniref:NAD/NADP octopine/nopaline dehydrogenase family protein n=1 Tax=Acetomicrobium sp. TaxID=1872099 RepID=UPI002FC8903C